MSNENKVNYGLVALVAIIGSVLGSLVTYKVMSTKTTGFAIVDLQRVVLSSKEIAALNAARQGQIQELKKMADDANEKIKEEKNEEAKRQLSQQYLNEINAKRDTYDRVHASGLQAADQTLNTVINKIAAEKGLSVIINKNAVVNGGTDITDAVVDAVK